MNSKFTIIVPSYNGGEYFKACVRSILSQTYADFELAILEDGSTDGSLEWLQTLNESRITTYPTLKNLGIVNNWARALEIPKCEFMTIVGHDDLLDPNYLEVMNSLIQQESDASLYFAHFRYINAKGEIIRPARPLPARETAADYIQALFSGERDTWGSGYMMRSQLYDEVGGIPKYKKLLFADDALWIKLMHRSWKVTAKEECFSVRVHPVSTGATAGLSWFDGMRPYITYLEELSKQDPEVERSFRTYGPTYFQSYCHAIYMCAIVEATKENKRLDPSFKQDLFNQLKRVNPQYPRELTDSRKMRIHEAINRNVIFRRIYQLYSLLRGGYKTP